MTLEDETDIANIIVWPKVFEKNRRTVMTARFLAVRGRLQRAGLVIHVVAESFVDLSAELPWLREGGDLFAPKFSGGPLPDDDGAAAQEPRLSLKWLFDTQRLPSRHCHTRLAIQLAAPAAAVPGRLDPPRRLKTSGKLRPAVVYDKNATTVGELQRYSVGSCACCRCPISSSA